VPSAGGPPPQCYGSHEDEHSERFRRLNIGLGIGTFNSTLRFEGDRDVDVEMSTVSLSASWRLNQKLSIRGGVGMILDGELESGNHISHEINPGALFSAGVEYIAVYGDGKKPYIDLTLVYSGSFTKTENAITNQRANYSAADLRVAARAGWNVNNSFFPYLTGRVFAGPVSWELDGEDETGSDIHHYQLAMGSAIQISRLSIYLEWAGLGEQAISVGLSTSF